MSCSRGWSGSGPDLGCGRTHASKPVQRVHGGRPSRSALGVIPEDALSVADALVPRLIECGKQECGYLGETVLGILCPAYSVYYFLYVQH